MSRAWAVVELGVKLPAKVKLDEIREILSKYRAFQNVTKLEMLAIKYTVKIICCPKYHCELNAIEGLWCNEKAFVRSRTDQSFEKMIKLISDSRTHFVGGKIALKLFRRFWRSIEAYSQAPVLLARRQQQQQEVLPKAPPRYGRQRRPADFAPSEISELYLMPTAWQPRYGSDFSTIPCLSRSVSFHMNDRREQESSPQGISTERSQIPKTACGSYNNNANTGVIRESDVIGLPLNRAVKDMVELFSKMNMSSTARGQQQVSCDNCSDKTALHWCEKCVKHYCSLCVREVHLLKVFQSHVSVPIAEKSSSFCTVHPDEKIKEHEFVRVQEAATEAKALMERKLREMRTMKQDLQHLNRISEEKVKVQQKENENTRNAIEHTISRMQTLLDMRKQVLIKQIDDDERAEISALQNQNQYIRNKMNSVDLINHCTRELVERNNNIHILKVKDDLLNSYKMLRREYKSLNFDSNTTTLQFNSAPATLAQFEQDISKLGVLQWKSTSIC
ncbi:unnamed protein product [Didymodactylos carnosus]|uniref:B box-type domain-containing protein n=1 Tax=Didymodactylos carnosus TaxID=1234261 RepID=A0A8S2EAW3_9BILA|nr:unnamed protein product [Didymodactylos carnosus]CAF3988272.1 unnamed protein product [Didymodactylos carnosus]